MLFRPIGKLFRLTGALISLTGALVQANQRASLQSAFVAHRHVTVLFESTIPAELVKVELQYTQKQRSFSQHERPGVSNIFSTLFKTIDCLPG